MSPDTEFGVKGLRSGIPYEKFAHAFKKMLIDGSQAGSRHTQRTMDVFNAAVFDRIAVASAGDENAESSEMELETDSEDSLARNNSDTADIESSLHSHTEQFQAMTISSTAFSPDYAACVSTPSSHRHLTATASISAPSPPAPVIDAATANSGVTELVTSSSSHVPTSRRSRQHLTPTASFSAPPPPIIDLEPQLIPEDNITPADSSSMEDDEEIAQPTVKGKAQAKKATMSRGHTVQPVKRRSTRAQAGKAK